AAITTSPKIKYWRRGANRPTCKLIRSNCDMVIGLFLFTKLSLCQIRTTGAGTELLRRQSDLLGAPRYSTQRRRCSQNHQPMPRHRPTSDAESATLHNQALQEHLRLIAVAQTSLHIYKRISEEKNRRGVNFSRKRPLWHNGANMEDAATGEVTRLLHQWQR